MELRGKTGKADLLLALAASHSLAQLKDNPAAQAHRDNLATLLRLERKPPAPPKDTVLPEVRGAGNGGADTGKGEPDDAAPRPAIRRPPLQSRFFALLQASDEAEPPLVDDAPAAEGPPTDFGPSAQGPSPFVPLIRRSRLWPALRRSLATPTLGALDVPVLVANIAQGRVLRRLPRRAQPVSAAEVFVVMDAADRLFPYDRDYRQLLQELRRVHGRAAITLWRVSEVPEAALSVSSRGRAHRVADGPVPLPPPGAAVLILGDLGCLSADAGAVDVWAEYCRQVCAAGGLPVAWVPMSGRMLPRRLLRCATVYSLATRDRLQPLRGGPVSGGPELAALRDRLLTRMACCVRVEPSLLRSLRQITPDTAAEPALEALVWSHTPVVEAGYRVCELGPLRQAFFRAAFAALAGTDAGRAEQIEVLRRMLALHAYSGRSTPSVEASIWLAHVSSDGLPEDLLKALQAALDWLQQLGAFAERVDGDIHGYACELFARHGADQNWLRNSSAALAPLWVLSGEERIPEGLNAGHIAAARRRMLPSAETRRFSLVQRGERLFLERWERVARQDSPLNASSPWPEISVADGFEWSRSDGALHSWLTPGSDALELPLGDAPGAYSFHLVSGRRHYQLGLLSRPSWAREWGFDAEGLYAQAPSPLGGEVRLHAKPWAPEAWQGSWPPGPRAFQASPVPIGQGMQLGADLQYGLYLDVPFGKATQRFRWIEPGEFLMGSPEGEAGRFDNEGPQHVVRLTEGYWLAEAPCSQMVWKAVKGFHLTYFRNELQNPVEQVSWDEVAGKHGFLTKLEGLLPGLRAALPTEAEWEYACRAGAKEAFNWGSDTITPTQANYDASVAYNGGPTGEYRKKTIPVKSFTPNAWGLYQMHGNVWEWCADGPRPYDGTPQQDPRGQTGDEKDAPRVVRGGSWPLSPHWLRAASRFSCTRSSGRHDLGFRLLLRSTSPGAERPPEAAGTRDA